MALEDFSLRLLFLLFPGLLAMTMVRNFTPFRQDEWARFTVYVVILSILSYVVLAVVEIGLAARWPHLVDGNVEFFRYLSEGEAPVSPTEVAWATAIGLFVGLGSSWLVNRGWIHKAARKMGLTTRSGTADIWDLAIGARGQAPWVTVRDYENKLAYHGWVKGASDRSDEPELLLFEVTVARNDGEILYDDLPALYLRRSPNALTVEIEEALIDGRHIGASSESGDDNDDEV